MIPRSRGWKNVRCGIAGLVGLLLALPSQATELTSTFLTSSTGSTTIELGDTIQFEVTLTTDLGKNYDTIYWSATGDAANAIGSNRNAGWPGVAHSTTEWIWHYTSSGGRRVKFGTNGRISPSVPPLPPPGPVSGMYGFGAVSARFGDGVPSMVGTLTITATTPGTFDGGAFMLPGVDGFLGSAGLDPVLVNTASFSVLSPAVPSASATSLGLLALGLAASVVTIQRLRRAHDAHRKESQDA